MTNCYIKYDAFDNGIQTPKLSKKKIDFYAYLQSRLKQV
jgi:hypothetical protein